MFQGDFRRHRGALFGCWHVRCFEEDAARSEPGLPGKETQMLDVLFMFITVGFFALSLAYTSACGRL